MFSGKKAGCGGLIERAASGAARAYFLLRQVSYYDATSARLKWSKRFAVNGRPKSLIFKADPRTSKGRNYAMSKDSIIPVQRRTILKAGLAIGAMQVASPFVIKSLADEPVKIGWVDPFSGTYAALGTSQLNGAKMALAEVNAKGGMLGRQVQILPEDNAANVGQATVKVNKLIDQDKVNFICGSVSSAVALAESQAANLKNTLYIATGGHVDTVTGTDCHWNTFKICSDTWMLAQALSKTLLSKFGKKWYFCTPDYAWGHFLYAGFSEILKKAGGTVLGNELMPLGSTDFSAALIKVQQAKPDVFIVLQGGDDFVNVMKQATQFGMTKNMAFGYGLVELEPLAALPKEARLGWGVMEWWWDQPNQPHVKAFVDKYRKTYASSSQSTPSARSWFGYVAVHSLAMAAAKAKSIDSVKMAHAMEGL
ncbi:MAG: ABC transporter substrate-binding protein, partial [Xanthobacteraceae bacterium]